VRAVGSGLVRGQVNQPSQLFCTLSSAVEYDVTQTLSRSWGTTDHTCRSVSKSYKCTSYRTICKILQMTAHMFIFDSGNVSINCTLGVISNSGLQRLDVK